MGRPQASHSDRDAPPVPTDWGDDRRERLIDALVDCAAAEGIERIAVTDVAAAAGLSERDFHEFFEDLEDCFCGAMETMLSEVMDRIAAAQKLEAPWPARIRNGVTAVLELFASRPNLARLVMVDAPSFGRRPPQLYASARRISRSLLDRGREDSPLSEVVPSSASGAALSATEARVFGEIIEGRAHRLVEVAPDVIYVIVSHYRSQDEALREFRLAAAR